MPTLQAVFAAYGAKNSLYKSTFTVKGDCQTATGAMLYFGLYEPEEYIPLVKKLISQIEERDWHLDFGVLGNKFVMQSLGAAGEGNVGQRMITRAENVPRLSEVDRPRRNDALGMLERHRLA